MKAYKKPVQIHFEYLQDDVIVETLEGPVHAGKDHVVITGVKGERYPCKKVDFLNNYNVDEDLGVAYKKKIIVDVVQLSQPTSVKVSWSDDLLHGKTGDYLVTYGPSDKAIVEKSIFEETYVIVEE
ncbi:MAG TPA: PGDYG domain-containing protein [Methanosarcina sp.]|nr:PGDYG domain-containing protein [Methanosarcina sp.]